MYSGKWLLDSKVWFFKVFISSKGPKKKKKASPALLFSHQCVFRLCLNETFLVMWQTQGLQAFVTMPASIPAFGWAGHTHFKIHKNNFWGWLTVLGSNWICCLVLVDVLFSQWTEQFNSVKPELGSVGENKVVFVCQGRHLVCLRQQNLIKVVVGCKLAVHGKILYICICYPSNLIFIFKVLGK